MEIPQEKLNETKLTRFNKICIKEKNVYKNLIEIIYVTDIKNS